MTTNDELEGKIDQMKKKAQLPKASEFMSKIFKRLFSRGGTEEMDAEGNILEELIPKKDSK